MSVLNEYGKREGEIVSGTVQRIERGNIFIDMGRATAILPFEEQIRRKIQTRRESSGLSL